MRTIIHPILAYLALLTVSSCACSTPPSEVEAEAEAPPASPAPNVLATVNGVELTEDDVRLSAQAGPGQRHDELDAAHRRALLDTTIRTELQAQEADRLGLELGDEEAAQLRALEAAARSFRRAKLAELHERHRQSQVEVSEADVRRYFDRNATSLQTDVHVSQILMRDEARIRQALEEIRGGASFEDVARSALPVVPEGERPWDLGFLRWTQVPDAWRESLEALEPGQTSEVIAGPRRRFWLVHLVARRPNDSITFETERATIQDRLRAERLRSGQVEATRELRERARIVYVERPAAPEEEGAAPEEAAEP